MDLQDILSRGSVTLEYRKKVEPCLAVAGDFLHLGFVTQEYPVDVIGTDFVFRHHFPQVFFHHPVFGFRQFGRNHVADVPPGRGVAQEFFLRDQRKAVFPLRFDVKQELAGGVESHGAVVGTMMEDKMERLVEEEEV